MNEMPSAAQILANLPAAILVINSKNLIGDVNPAAEILFGTSAKNLIGKRLETELEFDDVRLSPALHDNDASIEAHDVTVILRGNRTSIDFSIGSLVPSSDWRFVTLSRKPESFDTKDASKHGGEPFGIGAPDVLGHEIKNPLAAIRGAAQLLARTGDEASKLHTNMIISEVDRVASLIDRMQSLSATQPAKTQAVNIHTLIEQARQAIESATGRSDAISDNFDPSLPDVMADPDAMMQVLTNVIANAMDAVKHIEDPKIEILSRFSFGGTLSSQNSDRAVKLPIEIIIRDNGPGVPEDIENDIFSPFVTTKPDGQGLGLALVKKLMSDMNGRIIYERQVEQGVTQFTLFLPMANQG